MTSKQELLFVATGKTGDCEVIQVTAYREGGSYRIVGGPHFYSHLCHAIVKDFEGVKREIALVFNMHIEKIEYPTDLQAESRKHPEPPP
jgi:hypothetical protein